ncbi:hypothetical protein ACSBR2_017889 [Camellia fascicularis]
MTSISNMFRRLQSRTNEVQRLTEQLFMFQRMYQDAWWEISQLKRQNKELKRRTTTMARTLAPCCSSFGGQQGVISFANPANAEAWASRASPE